MRLQLQPGSWLGTPIPTLESELPTSLATWRVTTIPTPAPNRSTPVRLAQQTPISDCGEAITGVNQWGTI